jgi:predicted short-subunit dehydrogenase-like oxidoreductase (DUF2520 family)
MYGAAGALCMRELIIVGAGRVGRTLGRVLQQGRGVRVSLLVGQTRAHAEEAADFLQAGGAQRPEVSTELGSLSARGKHAGALIMVSTPDRSIGSIAEALTTEHLIDQRSVVFHCSGALSSEVLAPCRSLKARIASIHPLASFADPTRLSGEFQGVTCASEGDGDALDVLETLFRTSGARVIRLETSAKALYHAGAVFASGHVAAVLAAALAAERAAGIEHALAAAMLAPLIQMTVDNVLVHGALPAMTGPLPRGDDQVVLGHYQALLAADPALARCYADLTGYAATLLGRTDPLKEPH